MSVRLRGRRVALVAVALLVLSLSPPAGADHRRRPGSRVTAVVVDRVGGIGTVGGIPFERLVGHVEGRVHRSEEVVGLAEVVGDREFHIYRSEFELIRPVEKRSRRGVVVEVENRGSPLMLQVFNHMVIGFSGPPSKNSYAEGLGDGFVFDRGRSYARVQWQTGMSPGVPPTAQGVGEVIVRDFGRLLKSGRIGQDGSPLGRYETLIVTGISQSGWFIDTFLAEGFNAGPFGRRVYDGLWCSPVAGTGWPSISSGMMASPSGPTSVPTGGH